MTTITFKTKVKEYQSTETLEWSDAVLLIKEVQSHHVEDFKGDTTLHALTYKLSQMRRLVFLNNLPSNVTVSGSGFMREVTVELD